MEIGQQNAEEPKMGQPISYVTLSELYQVSKSTLCRMYSGEGSLGGVQYKKCKANTTIANSKSKQPEFKPIEVPAQRLRDCAL